MAQSSFKTGELLPEFRAPPPSPVAGWSDSPDTEDELAGFLTRSGRVPQLKLPDRIVHRTALKLPEVDIQSLKDPSSVEILRSAAASFGCFQVVNHGVESELIAAARDMAREAFAMPAKKKMELMRTSEASWGFVVEEGWDEEELWWSPQSEMTFKGFRDNIEHLWVKLENIAVKMEQLLVDPNIQVAPDQHPEITANGSALCFHKSGRERGICDEHDVLRVLIKNATCSHALALHMCVSDSTFHVYSKQGRISFRVNQGAIMFVVGEQIQRRSCGLYKKVIGKHFHKNGTHRDDISIMFIYSPPAYGKVITMPIDDDGKKIISILGQMRIATYLILLYHVLSYILC